EIVVMSSSLKAKISEAIIDEYKKEKAYKEQNRFSIKSRLEEAKKKAYENKPDTKVRQKEAVL
ncbi:MAG: hypothetical protein IKN47_00825, partial [Lachnospiraceae bacterium]|nr:hypothetical protein [Lachnospiraceae bacterium]